MFELDDERKVNSRKSNILLLSHVDKNTLEFEVRTVSYGPSSWPIYDPRAKKVIVGLFSSKGCRDTA